MKNVQECVVRVRIVIHQGGEGYAVWVAGQCRITFFSFFGGGGFRNVVRTPQG